VRYTATPAAPFAYAMTGASLSPRIDRQASGGGSQGIQSASMLDGTAESVAED
jgi:hypothetical protein